MINQAQFSRGLINALCHLCCGGESTVAPATLGPGCETKRVKLRGAVNATWRCVAGPPREGKGPLCVFPRLARCSGEPAAPLSVALLWSPVSSAELALLTLSPRSVVADSIFDFSSQAFHYPLVLFPTVPGAV